MSPEAITFLVQGGALIVLAYVVVTVARKVDTGKWLPESQLLKQEKMYERIFALQEETILRQADYIRRLGGVASGSLNVAEHISASTPATDRTGLTPDD